MRALYEPFLSRLKPGALILDAGCGSGRDAKYFLEQGFRVDAFDASAELARLASEFIGAPVRTATFDDVTDVQAYDAIWACASLVHLDEGGVERVVKRLKDALKPGGNMYVSFKYGRGTTESGGRTFYLFDETSFRDVLDGVSGLTEIQSWKTSDARPGRNDSWLNVLVQSF